MNINIISRKCTGADSAGNHNSLKHLANSICARCTQMTEEALALTAHLTHGLIYCGHSLFQYLGKIRVQT